MLFKSALAAFALLFSMSAENVVAGYSRGPYLPQDSELSVPGGFLARGGLNERCEERREPICDPYSEYILLNQGSGYEFGSVKYDCEEIDDGAYGALECTQKGYVKIESYSNCVELSHPPFMTTDLSFRSWYCTK